MVESGGSPTPTHAIFILLIVLTILGLPLLMPQDGEWRWPSLEDVSPLLMLTPLLLLLLVRALASQRAANLRLSDMDADTIHRMGGSSGGVLLVLVIVVAMIFLRSVILESWGVIDSE